MSRSWFYLTLETETPSGAISTEVDASVRSTIRLRSTVIETDYKDASTSFMQTTKKAVIGSDILEATINKESRVTHAIKQQSGD